MKTALIVTLLGLTLSMLATNGRADGAEATRIRSKDGTQIFVECAGSGPELLIVHGGAGDRTRWTPLFPYLERDLTVCAMDRRGHGRSGDGPTYSLQREAEDVAAVAKSRGRPVAVLGHSFGGVVAYEAAFLTPQIKRLALYEPPIRAADHSAALTRMEALLKVGDRDAATTLFLRDIVRVSPEEAAAMRSRPSWKALVDSIETSVRQDRALTANRWDPARARTLRTPTLLMIGGRTESAELRLSVRSLAETLPNREVVTLQGQEHNAMDTDREHLAAIVKAFVLAGR